MIEPQHLGQVIRDKNRTRKRTRHEHFPQTRYRKSINKKNELSKFYKEIKKYPIDKIISLDESHINKNIRPNYLCRGNLSDVLDDTTKSKFTRSEMGKPC